MIYSGNPLYKTPKRIVKWRSDYEVVDHLEIDAEYLPRTIYKPDMPIEQYRSHLPRCIWNPALSQVDFFRVAFRKMVNRNGERSLVSAIIPSGFAHIDGIQSVATRDPSHLLNFATGALSLSFDFLIKSLGKQNLHDGEIGSLPYIDPGNTARNRTLRLVCLTAAYTDLWNEQAPILSPLPWALFGPAPRARRPGDGTGNMGPLGRTAHRFRPPHGAGRNRRARSSGAWPDARSVNRHLSRLLPSAAAKGGRHVV